MGNFSISDVKSGETADQVRSDGGLTPAAHDYPRSHLPISPPLSMASFLRGLHGPVRSILDAGPRRYVTSGRVAIALALREAGVGPGDAVLVPSYHCASMIEPVIWAGATPVFYRIQPNTQVDLDDVAAKLDGRCKVLMATNYFGFPQDLSALRSWAAEAPGHRMSGGCGTAVQLAPSHRSTTLSPPQVAVAQAEPSGAAAIPSGVMTFARSAPDVTLHLLPSQ